jgi:hypothetical protein
MRISWWVVTLVMLVHARGALADAIKPEARAKELVDAQVARFQQGAAGKKPFLAMFRSDGVIVGDGNVSAIDAFHDDTIDRLFRNLQKRDKLTATMIAAGGTADAVWLGFELTLQDTVTKKFRISELLVRDAGGWKIAVAHIGTPQPDRWEDEEDSRDDGPIPWGEFPSDDGQPGPLAPLAASPAKLHKALAKHGATIVVGTTAKDLAVGEVAAAKLVGGWSKLPLVQSETFEQRGTSWGYAIVQLKLTRAKPGPRGPQAMKMRASVFAIPTSGGWQVVAAQFSRVLW